MSLSVSIILGFPVLSVKLTNLTCGYLISKFDTILLVPSLELSDPIKISIFDNGKDELIIIYFF